MQKPTSVDTLLHAKWIIPVEPDTAVLDQHSIAIDNGKIVALVPTSQTQELYCAQQTVTLNDHALIPGLINTHTHAAMSLFRGIADDLPLMDWLENHIWPAESRWVNDEFVHCGTQLAIAEMLLGGTTCFNDMYFFPEVAARTAEAAGMRSCAGLIVLDSPSNWAEHPDDYISKGLEIHDQYKNNPLITTAFAPHAPYTVSDQSLEKLRVLANELDIPVHIHLHETAQEVSSAAKETGRRPLQRLSELGLLSPSTIAVHMTQLTDAEITLFAESGGRIVHCPESNMKLASGMCPVQKLMDAGITVALGTDGAASNNDLDMFGEMRSAALLGKLIHGDPQALAAHSVLRMATINGAVTLGLGEETGSLKAGKWADITAVRMKGVEVEPVYDPVSQLIYACGRDQVSDVWIAGRQLVKSRELVSLDVEDILSRTRTWQDRIAPDR